MEQTGVEKIVSIPTRVLSSLLGLAILGPFTYAQYLGYIKPGFAELWNVEQWEAPITHIGLMWVPVIVYLLIAGNVCLVVRLVKPLKSWHENGLLQALSRWFVGGLGFGSSMGIVLGLPTGYLHQDYSVFLTLGLAIALWLTLTATLVVGLAFGLSDEFKETP